MAKKKPTKRLTKQPTKQEMTPEEAVRQTWEALGINASTENVRAWAEKHYGFDVPSVMADAGKARVFGNITGRPVLVRIPKKFIVNLDGFIKAWAKLGNRLVEQTKTEVVFEMRRDGN